MHYEHLVDGMFSLKNQAFPFTEAIICVVNLLMLQLRAFLSQMSHLRAFLSRMSWFRAFWGRILRRIFGRNSQKHAEFWQKICGKSWPLEPLLQSFWHWLKRPWIMFLKLWFSGAVIYFKWLNQLSLQVTLEEAEADELLLYIYHFARKHLWHF